MARTRRLPTSRRKLRRGHGTKSPEAVIAIFCEGKTEKLYLDELARDLRRTGVRVTVVGEQGVPRTVVRVAVDRLRALRGAATLGPGGREVWAVFDRDEHPELAAAVDQARANGIGIAWSNPCVELWALLHFIDRTAHVERHPCQRALRDHMPGYDHGSKPVFDVSSMTDERRLQARQRALALHRRADDAGDPLGNPTTAMWKLVDVLVHGSTEKAIAHAESAGDGSPRWWSPP